MHRVRRFALAVSLALVGFARPAAAQPPAHFLYGAALFYERIPRSQWEQTLRAYRSLGINTIDIYVMWNWHEPSEGAYDFTGRTNPRRDLVGLLRLIHADGFHIVLRPGPVIRNEWRNGGYPAWLLERPDYRMPLRDILEGRYPATATFQNAHSDSAAAQWMRNRTHMRYATAWLRHVFAAIAPFRRDITAVALDDDQGAYLTNDTWPGDHFHAYIRYLASVAHESLGESMPVFINTYDMKVTASAPVWAWGTWYQSDAYRITEHDREQAEFATALLQTQSPQRPVMISEFQAGWLQGADEAWPRAADPANTYLALHTFLQMGAHGVVNFPVQDTFYPSGWEAPWTNAFYAWDAALSVQLTAQPRFAPTQRFGALMASYGDAIAGTHPAADAAIAYMTSAYDPATIDNAQVSAIAAATIAAQTDCRTRRLTCALVDPRFDRDRLRKYPEIVIPQSVIALPYVAQVSAALDAYRKSGGRLVSSPSQLRVARPAAGGIPNAVLLVANNSRYGFLDVVNYDDAPLKTGAAVVSAGGFSARVPALTVPARDALLLPLGVRAANVTLPPLPRAASAGIAIRQGSRVDLNDGFPQRTFENSDLRAIVSLCAGARVFVLQDRGRGDNLFTSIGGLRDGWTPELPPSSRDYIAAYTHPLPAGTYNRCYRLTSSTATSAAFAYRAPDAPGGAARFEKWVRVRNLDGVGSFLDVATIAHFGSRSHQHAIEISSLAFPRGARVVRRSHALAIFETARRRVVMMSWSGSGFSAMNAAVRSADVLVTLTYDADKAFGVRYGVARATALAAAQARFAAFANAPFRLGEVAEWQTQPPQKRPGLRP